MTRFAESLSISQTLAFKDWNRFSLLNLPNFASCFDKLWRLSSESKLDLLSTTSLTSKRELKSLRKSTHISSNLLIVHSLTEQRWSLSTTVICECISMWKTYLSTSNVSLMLHSRWDNSFMTQTSMFLKASSLLKEHQKIFLKKNSKRKLKTRQQSRLLTSQAMSLLKTLLI